MGEDTVYRYLALTAMIPICSPFSAWSADECKPNLIEYDVCETAKRMAGELADFLPMKMSQKIMIEKVFAIRNTISLTAVLNYDRRSIGSYAIQNGASLQEVDARMANATKAHVCQQKSPTQAFVRLGGKIQYIYRFADGTPYLTIDVDHCA